MSSVGLRHRPLCPRPRRSALRSRLSGAAGAANPHTPDLLEQNTLGTKEHLPGQRLPLEPTRASPDPPSQPGHCARKTAEKEPQRGGHAGWASSLRADGGAADAEPGRSARRESRWPELASWPPAGLHHQGRESQAAALLSCQDVRG